MRYIDNTDGTVTDTSTGLMWKQAEEGRAYAWDEACTIRQEFAGFDDWRLPTIHELFSIIDIARYAPAIDPIFKSKNSSVWSGSPYANYSNYAWFVYFYYGSAAYSYRRSNYGVRLVRNVRTEN